MLNRQAVVDACSGNPNFPHWAEVIADPLIEGLWINSILPNLLEQELEITVIDLTVGEIGA